MDVTNWQEWAVALVVGVCIGIVLYKMYLFFGNIKAKNKVIPEGDTVQNDINYLL